MSHEATTWAIKQRGLKPTAKIVLWHLCDRYNPDYGCFPSQARLAHDCEISRSTLNGHLGHLEALGLLRRVPRVDPATKRQLPTRYILGFEPGFTPVDRGPCPQTGHGSADLDDEGAPSPEPALEPADFVDPCPDSAHGQPAEPVSGFDAEPCPDFGPSRVRNPDTNLVREPLRESVKEEEDAQTRETDFDRLFDELLHSLGLDAAALPGWWQGWPARLHVRRWRDQLGLSPEEILAVAEDSRREHPVPPDGPKALDRAMQRAAGRKASAGTGTGAGVLRAGQRGPSGPKGRRSTTPSTPASQEAVAAFYAELVNSDRFLASSTISNTLRDALLARGLVTRERLRQRGIQ